MEMSSSTYTMKVVVREVVRNSEGPEGRSLVLQDGIVDVAVVVVVITR